MPQMTLATPNAPTNGCKKVSIAPPEHRTRIMRQLRRWHEHSWRMNGDLIITHPFFERVDQSRCTSARLQNKWSSGVRLLSIAVEALDQFIMRQHLSAMRPFCIETSLHNGLSITLEVSEYGHGVVVKSGRNVFVRVAPTIDDMLEITLPFGPLDQKMQEQIVSAIWCAAAGAQTLPSALLLG